MGGPDPAVAATRLAVRRALAGAADPAGQRVLVACSGGADSLALLAAAVFEARDRPWSVVGVTVDHGLREDSAEVADAVRRAYTRLATDLSPAVDPAVDTSALSDRLTALCREQLAGFQVPKRIEVLTGLPKTATGKIQKHELRERFRG